MADHLANTQGFGRTGVYKTSGRYLIGLLERKAADDAAVLPRFEIGQDVFIKQQSYARLNKTFFFISLAFVLLVAFWPLLIEILRGTPALKDWGGIFDSAVAQTTFTSIAAFSVYTYQTYKQKQTAAEHLLRLLVFSSLPTEQLCETILHELNRLDRGFGFKLGKHPAERE